MIASALGMRKSAVAAQAKMMSSMVKKDTGAGKQSRQTKVAEFVPSPEKKSPLKSRASKKKEALQKEADMFIDSIAQQVEAAEEKDVTLSENSPDKADDKSSEVDKNSGVAGDRNLHGMDLGDEDDSQ